MQTPARTRAGSKLAPILKCAQFAAIVAKPAYAGYNQLTYIHLVWATWDRLPLITDRIEDRVYAAIAEKCRQLKCVPLEIGGIADHVHVLVRLHPTVALAELVKEIKGSSSHLVTHQILPGEFFKWQGAYGAFTLRKEDVPQVKAYIENQKQHHAEHHLLAELEQTMIEEEAEVGITGE